MSQTKLKILKLCQVNLLQILLLSTWFILGASVSPEVKKASLDGHNEHRKNAGLDLFEWRAGLGDRATKYSKKLGEEGECKKLSHSENRENIGENLYATSQGDQGGEAIAKMAVEAWYSETKFYSYPGDESYDTCDGGDKFSEYGHLTQMMWQKSGELGCAEYVCPDSGWAIFTCNYSPAGNTQGEKMFPESNFKKLCEAEPGVWTTCKENLVTEGCKMGRGQMTDENEVLMALLVACGITLGKPSYASYDVY